MNSWPLTDGLPLILFLSFIVTLGWIMGKPLTLLFDPYQSIAMFLAGTDILSLLKAAAQLIVVIVLTVNYVVHYARSTWLEVRASMPMPTEC